MLPFSCIRHLLPISDNKVCFAFEERFVEADVSFHKILHAWYICKNHFTAQTGQINSDEPNSTAQIKHSFPLQIKAAFFRKIMQGLRRYNCLDDIKDTVLVVLAPEPSNKLLLSSMLITFPYQQPEQSSIFICLGKTVDSSPNMLIIFVNNYNRNDSNHLKIQPLPCLLPKPHLARVHSRCLAQKWSHSHRQAGVCGQQYVYAAPSQRRRYKETAASIGRHERRNLPARICDSGCLHANHIGLARYDEIHVQGQQVNDSNRVMHVTLYYQLHKCGSTLAFCDYNLNRQKMECCLPPKRKNRPPAKEYQPYNSGDIQVVKEKERNDMLAINEELQKTSKLNKFSKLRLDTPQENIPFPPKTINVQISM